MAQDPLNLGAAVLRSEEDEQRRRVQGAGQTLYRARGGVTPERAALAQRAAAVLGAAPIEVEADDSLLEEAQAREDLTTLRDHQASINWLSNPENAAVGRDQVRSLTQMERQSIGLLAAPAASAEPANGFARQRAWLNSIARAPLEGLGLGLGSTVQGAGALGDTYNRLNQSAPDARLSRWLLNQIGLGDEDTAARAADSQRMEDTRQIGRQIQRGARNIGGTATPREAQTLALGLPQNQVDRGLVGDVASGVGQVAGQIAITAASAGTLTLPALFSQGAGAMDERVIQDMARDGRTERTGADDAAVIGGAVVTAAAEKLGLDAILGRLPKPIRDRITNRLVDVFVAGAVEGSSEVVEGIGQNVIANAALDEGSGVFDGTVEGGTVGALTGSVVRSLILTAIPGRQFVENQVRAEVAPGNADRFDQLAESVAANPLLERSPERLRAFLESATDGSNVYVPAEAAATFFQSNPDLADWIDEWDIRDQYEAAVVSGADIAIPKALYLTSVAQTPAHEAWRNDLRHGIDAMSVKEAEEFAANGEAELTAGFDQAMTDAEAIGQQTAPQAAVYNALFSELRAAGYTIDAAQTQATLAATYFNRRAERSGGRFADAMAAYRDANLSIRQEFPESIRQRMDQTDVLIEALRASRKAPSQQAVTGRSLAEFISAEGGIDDTGGELTAMGANQWHRGKRPGTRKLIRAGEASGRFGSDSVAQRAIEAGYLPEGADGNALFEALREEMAGRPVYSREFERDMFGEETRGAVDDLEAVLANLGIDPVTATNAEIKAALDTFANAPEATADATYNQFAGQNAEGAPLADLERAKAMEAAGDLPSDIWEATGWGRGDDGKWRFEISDEGAALKPDALERTAALAMSGQNTTALSEVFDHPRLFEAYPALAYTKTAIMDLPGNASGMVARDENGQTIVLLNRETAEKDPDKAAQILIHEVQHLIQTVEGFAKGAPSRPDDLKAAGYGDALQERTLAALEAGYDGDYAAAENTQAFKVYRRSAGEIEARNTEKRREYTDEERRFFPPAYTRDIQSDEAIVRFEGGDQTLMVSEASIQEAASLPTDSEAFRAWFGDSKVRDANGEPMVVYHGTTGEFDAFDQSRANIESDLGAGFYFSNTTDDVASNYAGEGPDLTQRIERMAERIAGETDREYDDPDVVAEAREALSVQNGGATLPVYLSIKNPVRLGGQDETRLTFEENYNEELDGYEEATGTALDFVEALQAIDESGDFMDMDVEAARGKVLELVGEDGDATVREIIAALKDGEDGGLLYSVDADSGDLASNEIIRRALEAMGYDGFIDQTVDEKFGSSRESGQKMAGVTEETTHYIAFRPEQIKSVFNRGTFDPADPRILFQEARGQISLSDTGAVITLFRSRNLSTFFHEFGHLTLELLVKDASLSAEARADLDAAMKHLGITDPSEIGVEQHELWARSFETYLTEGKAPTLELRSVFRTVKAWMLSIYRTALNLNAPITDEVRAVFDRLLASDDQLADAKAQLSMDADLSELEREIMTPAQQAEYVRLVERATGDAESAMLARVMDTVRRQRTAEWNAEADELRPDVSLEVDDNPDIKALAWLKAASATMDRAVVIQMMGDEAGVDLLPRGAATKKGRNAVHPDTLAEVAGYPSGQAMLNALMEHEAERRNMRAAGDNRSVRAKRIEDMVTERLRERYGDALSDGSIQTEAVDALHGEKMDRAISVRWAAVARSANLPPPPPLASLRAWAAEKIGARTVREARPGRYLRAERKASTAAVKALRAGNRIDGARQLQIQTINRLLYSEARKAETDAEKITRTLSRLDRSRTIKSIDQDYLDQIHALLEQYELRPASGSQVRRRLALLEFVNEQQALGNEIVVPPALIDAARKKNYADLTVDELRALNDTVSSLSALGRLKQSILDNRERRSFETVISEFLGATFDLKDRKGLEGRNRKKNGVRLFDASLWKVETLADWMDRDDVNGVMNRVLIRPATDAANKEDELHTSVGALIREKYEAVPRKTRRRWREKITINELADSETGGPTVLDRGDLIAIALNVGNASNLDKLTRGEEWTQEDVMTVLDRELTVEEWQMVQGIWDAIETLWPDIAATERKLTGVEPERVLPTTLQTKAGELRGGYYPVVYDPARRANAAAWAAMETADIFNGVITGAATSKGHTETRTNYAGPILLSVEGVLFGHMNKVIKRIAYADYVSSARKFITDDRVRNMITKKVGPEYYDLLMPWLQAQVTDRGGNNRDLEGLEKFVKRARLNYQMVAMGFRATTGLAQVAGFAQSAALVKNGLLAKNIGLYSAQIRLGNNRMTDFVWGLSGEMRSRQRSLDRDLRDAMRDLTDKNGPLAEIQRAAFMHIAVADQMVSIPTWVAAYESVIQNGGEEADAIAEGDKAVRKSQGNGREYALAAVQRPNSEFMKLFTLFYSYFSVQYNRQRDIVRYATTGDPVKAIAQAWWILAVAPVLGALLTGDAPDDEDEDEGPIGKWGSWMARKFFFNLFSGVPGLRDAASTTERKLSGKYASYSPTPLGGVYAKVEQSVKVGVDIATGEEPSTRAVKTLIETPGYFIGLPTGQLSSTVQYGVDVFNGDQQPEGAGEFLYGLMKGPQENQE